MKPAPFEYYAPTTTEEALAYMDRFGYEAKVLAGGQSLIPTMNFRLAQPSILVDLNRVSDLSYIDRAGNGGLSLGAMTRVSQVERDPLVGERFPMILGAIPHIAHPQIRNRSTVGGTMAHADPAAELPAVAVALKARFRLRSRTNGERWVAADDFFVGMFSTSLEPDEILVEMALPPVPPRSGWSFREVARRHGDFALVGVAAVVTLNAEGQCQDARLVFLSVEDRPMLAAQAGQILQGQVATAELIQAAAETAGDVDIEPTTDIHASADFRRHLVKVLARQALTQAFDRIQDGIPGKGG